MRALVTGAAGFIGRYVVRAFLAAGHEVVALDGLTYAGDANRLAGAGAGVVYHDLRSPVNELVAARIGRVDVALHLAADSHVDRSITHPLPAIQNNVMGGAHFLDYCRGEMKRGLRKVILVSTDEVFGPAPPGVFFDEGAPYRPSNPYAASKASVDCLGVAYWRTFGLPVIGTHAMNNFGPGQHEEKFIPKACRLLLGGEEVPVHGVENADGLWEPGSRTWIHAEDTAAALLFIAENVAPALYPDDGPLRFNIVGEREMSNMDVACRVAWELRVPLRFRWEEVARARPGHDTRYSLDGSRLRALGWKTGDFNRQFRDTVLAIRSEIERSG